MSIFGHDSNAVSIPPQEMLDQCTTFEEYRRITNAWYGRDIIGLMLTDPSPAFLEALATRFPNDVILVNGRA